MQPDCHVFRDLMPSYVDDMVSETTKQQVSEHLDACASCRAYRDGLLYKPCVTLPVTEDVQRRLKRAGRRGRMRSVLPVITAVLALLTLIAGWLIYSWVPVWISYEDAVIAGEQVNSFAFRVYTQSEVYGTYALAERVDGNSVEAVSFFGYRGDLFYDEPYLEDGFAGFHADNEVWFYGGFTGEEDMLLHGDGISDAQSVMQTNRNKNVDKMHNTSLYYLCWGGLLIGALCLLCGVLLRKKSAGRVLLLTAMPFLCCWLACLFVTDGYLTCSTEWISNIGMGYLRRYVSIGAMTLLMWATGWSIWALCRSGRIRK